MRPFAKNQNAHKQLEGCSTGLQSPIWHFLRGEALQNFPALFQKFFSFSLSPSKPAGCFPAAALELGSAPSSQFLILLSRTLLFGEQWSCVKRRQNLAGEKNVMERSLLCKVMYFPLSASCCFHISFARCMKYSDVVSNIYCTGDLWIRPKPSSREVNLIVSPSVSRVN